MYKLMILYKHNDFWKIFSIHNTRAEAEINARKVLEASKNYPDITIIDFKILEM